MRIYEKLEKRLLVNHSGEFVAVEPESGDYFVDKDELKAIQKAMKKHPGKLFELYKIGSPVAHKMLQCEPTSA